MTRTAKQVLLDTWNKEALLLPLGDTTKARLIYPTGDVAEFDNQEIALACWLGTPKGIRIAFRGKGDTTLVYRWDCVDRP